MARRKQIWLILLVIVVIIFVIPYIMFKGSYNNLVSLDENTNEAGPT